MLEWLPILGKKKSDAKTNGISDSTIVPLDTKDAIAPKQEKVLYVDEPNVWIINDGLLRDEGVLFGLSGADATEKIEAINSYYQQEKAPSLAAKQLEEERFAQKQKDIDALQQKLEKVLVAKEKEQTIPNTVSTAKVVRYLLGLAVMVIAAVGSFYLIHFYVTPIYGILATCGIFFFGLFAQMAPISSWLQTTDTKANSKVQQYKEYLLEIGPSVSATLLTAYLIYKQTNDVMLSIMIGLFLLFLFFFNGKLILGLVQTLVQEVKQFKQFRLDRKKAKDSKKDSEEEITSLENKLTSLRTDLETINKSQKQAETKIEELEEERNKKVKLFLSEYRLADHFSKTVNAESHE